MDIKTYISSGILQEYALGHVNDQERREVECLSKIYPELKEALQIAEADLEQFAKAYAKKAPSELRSTILSAVKEHAQEPAMQVVGKVQEADKEIVVQSEVTERKSIWTGLSAAAAVIAICLAGWQFAENNSTKEELQALQNQQNQLQQVSVELENRIAQLSDGLNEVYNPSVRKVTLKSVKENDNTKLALLWNTETGEVKLNTSGLPALPADKQYQLWVLTDGVPADMGVLSKTEQGILVASNATKKGDAFAITIEPLGGKASPSLDQLVVLGETT